MDEFQIPKLSNGYVSVLRVDNRNGRILNNDNTYFDDYQDSTEKGGKIYYHIYRSYNEAKNEILLSLEKSLLYEYVIYDDEGNELEHILPKIEDIPPTQKGKNIFVRLWQKIIG